MSEFTKISEGIMCYQADFARCDKCGENDCECEEDEREDGFYWVDVKNSTGVVREVAEWAVDEWFVCGYESDLHPTEVSNINENRITEQES